MSIAHVTTQTTSSTAVLPVSLAEAKTHLRIAHGDLDSSVQLALESAVNYVEDALGRSLRETETLVQSYGCWPKNPVRFDRQPVVSIVSVYYYDTDDTDTLLASSNYRLLKSTRAAAVMEFDADFSKPSLATRSDSVRITYTAGYSVVGGKIDIPPQVRWAILLALGSSWGDYLPREQEACERSIRALLSSAEWGSYR